VSVSFKPGLPLSICTLLAFGVLVYLGTWQALKSGPKTKLLATIDTNMSAEAIPLPVHVDDPAALAYRHVSFIGTRQAQPVKIFGTNRTGKPGYYLYTPVKHVYGRIVMVNYGWIPMEHSGDISLPEGEQVIKGVLMESATPGSMTPDNDPATGIWFTADVHELALHYGFSSKEYYPFRLFVDHEGALDSLPLGGQVRIDIPNDHFQYALTWYGLALGLIGVYITFGMKRARLKP